MDEIRRHPASADMCYPSAQLPLPGLLRAVPTGGGHAWQLEQAMQDQQLSITPLHLGSNPPPLYRAAAAIHPALLPATQLAVGPAFRSAATAQLPWQAPQQQLVAEAFSKYVLQSNANSYVYGGHTSQAAPPHAQLFATRTPVPVAGWQPPPPSAAHLCTKLGSTPATAAAGAGIGAGAAAAGLGAAAAAAGVGRAAPDSAEHLTLVRPQPIRPAVSPLAGRLITPFGHPAEAPCTDLLHALQPTAQEAAAVLGAASSRAPNGAQPAGVHSQTIAVQGLQNREAYADTTPLLCAEPSLPRSGSDGSRSAAIALENTISAAVQTDSPRCPSCTVTGCRLEPLRGPVHEASLAGEAFIELVSQTKASGQPGQVAEKQEQEQDQSVRLCYTDSVLQEVELGRAQLTPGSPTGLTAASELPILASPARPAAGSGSPPPGGPIAEHEQRPGQSGECAAGAAQRGEAPIADDEAAAVAQREGRKRASGCGAHGGERDAGGVKVPVVRLYLLAEQSGAGREPSVRADGQPVSEGVSVPVEVLHEGVMTAELAEVEREMLPAAGALCSPPGPLGGPPPAASSSPPRLVVEPCTEACGLFAGRLKRVPGGDPLSNKHVRRLCEMLRADSREFQAGGRVLRLKQYVSADIKPPHINAILDALAANTRVEVLYIQNFEWGMLDAQLEHLVEVLKKKRIWGLNVGENFQITLPAWGRFTAQLQHTAVAYLYVSEHHLGGTDLKIRMRDAIRINRKAGPARDPEVICKVGNMWFNPKMPNHPPRRPSSKAAAGGRKLLLPKAAGGTRVTKSGRALQRGILSAVWLTGASFDAATLPFQRSAKRPLDGRGGGGASAADRPAKRLRQPSTWFADGAQRVQQLKRAAGQLPAQGSLQAQPRRKTAAEYAADRQAQLLERAVLPAWLPRTMADSLPRAAADRSEDAAAQQQEPAAARTAPMNAQAAMKQRERVPLLQALQAYSNARSTKSSREGEEAKQVAFIWLMQKWRQMSVLPHNEWKPSILAAAAAHQQSVSAAAAAAAALAALAAPASSPVELGSITEAAPVLKHKKLPLPLGVSLTSMVAAAGGKCADCGTHETPMWRRWGDTVVCNRCGCRRRNAKAGRQAAAQSSAKSAPLPQLRRKPPLAKKLAVARSSSAAAAATAVKAAAAQARAGAARAAANARSARAKWPSGRATGASHAAAAVSTVCRHSVPSPAAPVSVPQQLSGSVDAPPAPKAECRDSAVFSVPAGPSAAGQAAIPMRTCADCKTLQTPLWRRMDGEVLCNACWCRHRKVSSAKSTASQRSSRQAPTTRNAAAASRENAKIAAASSATAASTAAQAEHHKTHARACAHTTVAANTAADASSDSPVHPSATGMGDSNAAAAKAAAAEAINVSAADVMESTAAAPAMAPEWRRRKGARMTMTPLWQRDFTAFESE